MVFHVGRIGLSSGLQQLGIVREVRVVVVVCW
jgi:hypothetical protein